MTRDNSGQVTSAIKKAFDRRASYRRILSRCLPYSVPLMGVYLTGVRLTGVHLVGVHYTGLHLIGVKYTGVHLIGVTL